MCKRSTTEISNSRPMTDLFGDFIPIVDSAAERLYQERMHRRRVQQIAPHRRVLRGQENLSDEIYFDRCRANQDPPKNSLRNDDGYDDTSAHPSSCSAKFKPTPENPGFTAKHHRRHFVQHNYHDHANDEEEDPSAPCDSSKQDHHPSLGMNASFPLLLHQMLDYVEAYSLEHIASWQPHGRAFCVFLPKAFVNKIMPKFFRQSKISSFQRQLNLYGFVRLNGAGPDKGSYYHEFFLRGRPDLVHHMHRTRVKGTGVRTSSNPNAEPDFYKLPPLPRTTPMSVANFVSKWTSVNERRPLDQPCLVAPSSTELNTKPKPFRHGSHSAFDSFDPRLSQPKTVIPPRYEEIRRPSPSLTPQLVPTSLNDSPLVGVEDVAEMNQFLQDADLTSEDSGSDDFVRVEMV